MDKNASNEGLQLKNITAFIVCHAPLSNAVLNMRNRKKWGTQVNAAKNVWGRLSDDELNNVDGRFHVLIGLIRARYHLSYDDAYDQVNCFFAREKPNEPPIECIDVFWSQKVKAAHRFWPGLAEPDLLESKGEPKQLVALLQQHYIIAFSEAVRQVDTFLERHSAVGVR